MATYTWYLTEAVPDAGGTGWDTGTSNQVKVFFGTEDQWDLLTPVQQAEYDIKILDGYDGAAPDGLVDGDELKEAMQLYSTTNKLGYNFPNNSGYLGTDAIDLDGNPATPDQASVGMAVDGKSIQSSKEIVIISLEQITHEPIVSEYKPGSGNFTAFDPGTLLPPPDDCLVCGSLIRTADGEKLVEDLMAGDLVLTADHGLQPVKMVKSSVVTEGRLAGNPALCPIRIRAGALGQGLPQQDLLVSQQHRILVRSKIASRMFGVPEALVAAKQLLYIDGIELAEDVTEFEYFHILFDRHEIIYANGAATESLYLGTECMKHMRPLLREEILTIFPELKDSTAEIEPARLLVPGVRGRRLAQRHGDNHQELVG
ncbi:Hint domain-containing protein [Paracoccus isoporae]|uniref:Hint domain-containing protein n=1 Tax=Paracoccus isoporae TaxID=591205 RepID=A0A1G6SMP5_9RHOB|nr:Hint domain-containing protein [Paracoccus isoporae]SDD17901.1 Hint domain-containing protein [Paracoccus isoporae]